MHAEDFGQARALGEHAEALEARLAAAHAGGTLGGQPAEVRHACPLFSSRRIRSDTLGISPRRALSQYYK